VDQRLGNRQRLIKVRDGRAIALHVKEVK
jgi:hypothetical protein